MNTNRIIIDVKPVEHSRARVSTDGFGNSPVHEQGNVQANVAARSVEGAFGGLAQIVVGTGLVFVGLPMLILPGPGLLAIGAGAALAASGFRKLLG